MKTAIILQETLTIVLEKHESGVWAAFVPEIPGNCSVVGDSRCACLLGILDRVRDYCSGKEPPSLPDELRAQDG